MRVYALTKLGKKVTSTRDSSDGELKILQYIRENKTATDSELDIIGDRWQIRSLKEHGLIKELTT